MPLPSSDGFSLLQQVCFLFLLRENQSFGPKRHLQKSEISNGNSVTAIYLLTMQPADRIRKAPKKNIAMKVKFGKEPGVAARAVPQHVGRKSK